jgi:hypothetical protein
MEGLLVVASVGRGVSGSVGATTGAWVGCWEGVPVVFGVVGWVAGGGAVDTNVGDKVSGCRVGNNAGDRVGLGVSNIESLVGFPIDDSIVG